MSNSNIKLTSLVLSFALVTGMFVGFVPTSVPAAAGNQPVSPVGDNPVELDDGEYYFLGQELARTDGITEGERYRVVSDSGSLVDGLVGNENGYVYIELDDSYKSGEQYTLEDSSGNKIAEFNVERQSIDVQQVEKDPSVRNGGLYTETQIIFNGTSRFKSPLVVSTVGGDGNKTLNASQLDSVFKGGEVVTDDGEKKFFFAQVRNDREFNLNFTGVKSGEYSFKFDVADTTASEIVQINVRDDRDGAADFSRSTIDGRVGDVIEINVDYTDTSRSTIIIGNEEEVSYEYRFILVDDNGDGDASVKFNTTKAGSGVVPVTAGDNSSIVQANKDTAVETPPIDPASYELRAVVGDETDISILRLRDVGVEGSSSLSTYPSAEVDTLDEASKTQTVAQGDKFIIKYNLNGLYGELSNRDASSLVEGSEFAERYGVYVTASTTDPELNQDPRTVDVDTGTLFTNSEKEHLYLVYNTSDFDWLNPEKDGNNNINFTLHINSSNPYVEDGEEITQSESIQVVERSLSLDAETGDGMLRYRGTDKITVNGTTTISPGTEADIVIRRDDKPAFLMSEDVNVTENHTVSATFTLPESLQPNSEFTVEINPLKGERMQAEVVSDVEANLTVQDQKVLVGENATVEQATLPEGGYVVVYSGTSMSQNVVGSSERLANGTHGTIQVPLEEEVSNSEKLLAVLHRGDDSTDPSRNDPYYTTDNKVVSETFEIKQITETPTPTPTSTPEPTDTPVIEETPTATPPTQTETLTPTPTPTVGLTTETPTPVPTPTETTEEPTSVPSPTDDTQEATTTETNAPAPGFGAILGLIAILGIALIALRRKE